MLFGFLIILSTNCNELVNFLNMPFQVQVCERNHQPGDDVTVSKIAHSCVIVFQDVMLFATFDY